MTKNSKDKGRKWDGKSRVSNDLYRKNFDEIFKKRVMEGKDPFKKPTDENAEELVHGGAPFKKEQDELKESYEQSKLSKKEREKLLKEIEERNGF